MGWIDFGTSQGNVHVTDSELTGYAWGETAGWISLNCSNTSSCGTVYYRVGNNGEGVLSGYAWSENAGWIQFNPAGGGVTIDSGGNFAGEAWGETIGWIVFNCLTTNDCATVSYRVVTDWRPSSNRSTAISTSVDVATPSGGNRGSTFVPPPSPFLGKPSPFVSSFSSPSTKTVTAASSSAQRMEVFSDVPESSWFFSYIQSLLKDGIISGYKDANGNPTGAFKPGNPVTEGEILKMALLASGKTVGNGIPHNTSAKNDWSAPYVQEAEALHLSVYISSLDIHQAATRGQVIQTVLEAFGVTSATGENPFLDLPSISTFAPAIETAYRLGIVSGDTDAQGNLVGTVRPDDGINRAEAAKIIVRAMQVLKK